MNAISFLDTASTILSISIAAVLGVLSRVFFNSLFDGSGAGVTSSVSIVFVDLPANILGSFFLGAFLSIKTRFSAPLFISVAVSTGYAGCLTTFASWNYQLVRMFSRGDWVAALFAAVFGTALPFSALILGRDTADYFIQIFNNFSLGRADHNPSTTEVFTANTIAIVPDLYGLDLDLEVDPEVDSKTSECTNTPATASTIVTTSEAPTMRQLLIRIGFTLPLCAVSLAGVSAAAATDEGYRKEWASAAMAPVGALIRWYLSRLNRDGGFPVGTFSANILATLFDAAIGAASLRHGVSRNVEIVLSALITGFAGSLSTVSTWVNEAAGMQRWKRYTYLFLTVSVAQLLGIMVYGIVYWIELDKL